MNSALDYPQQKPQATRPTDSQSPTPDTTQDPDPGLEVGHLHQLFEAWSQWSRTRRYYGPPPKSGTILGQLSSKTRPYRAGPPDIACSLHLSALHLAILGQPQTALDTQVFYAYYSHRSGDIKRSAAMLGISRAHFYRLLRDFCTRVQAAARVIATDNIAQREALEHL